MSKQAWRVASLGSVADFYGGSSLPAGERYAAQAGGYLLLKVSDMNLPGNESVIRSSQEWSRSPGPRSATCPAGSVIIPKRGGAIGTNKKRITARPAVLDPNLMAIAPHREVDARYLYHWFLCFDLLTITNGSSVPQLNKRDLQPLPLPLPPLEEQRRIAKVLDRADELRVKRRQAIAYLDKLGQSIFIGMFGRPDEYESRWPIITVGRAGRVQLGRQRAPKYQTGKFTHPYLRVANVHENQIDTSDILHMDFDDEDFRNYCLEYGDILLNEGQSTELVGRPAMWRSEISNCCFQNTLVRFQASDGMVDKTFALGVFISYFRTGKFARISSKTSNVAHLGAARFASMPFPVPALAAQQRYAKVFQSIEQLTAGLQTQSAELDGLFAALQDRAFAGEL